MNRKRAAYILSTYFCDDLVPINVELPEVHSEQGPHGNQAACLSCHYKLDPMAGFFRERGRSGYNFSARKTIQFDDGASENVQSYNQQWTFAPETKTNIRWNVGYIRSTKFVDKNEYADDLPGLFKIIGRASEVKACLVKRMAEFFIGDNQVFDGAYLDDLTDRFNQESRTDSSRAFKNTVRRLLTSQAFAQSEPDPSRCYDAAPGEKIASEIPCDVAHVIRQNCLLCHSHWWPEAHLDLGSWISKGGEHSFSHKDKSGKEYSKTETFQRILGRLSNSDPDLRMPYRRYIAAGDRQKLFLWVNRGLQKESK
jgi:hypothetical protein